MTDRYVKLVNGVEVEMTADEIAARQTEEALPPAPLPLLDRLTAIFESLSAADQATFAQLDSVVFVQVEKGRIALAKTLVQNTTVPDGPLADIKTQILAELDKG